MPVESSPEEAASASQVMRQFIQSVDSGNVRCELAEDCILNLFARSVKGVDAVSCYMRAQLTGRFKHERFQRTDRCDGSQELQIKERYQRCFQVLNRRIRLRKDLQAAAESRPQVSNPSGPDDIDGESNANQLITPVRVYPSDHSLALAKFVQSIGVIEACHPPDDGGLDFDQIKQVRITLGYRHSATDERITEICLVVYEKWPLPAYLRTFKAHVRMRSNFRTTNTDDEGELPETRTVRRILFSSKDCDEPEESDKSSLIDDEEVAYMSAPTPCKRQHQPDNKVNAKRLTGSGGMRF